MVKAYNRSVATLNLIRAFIGGGNHMEKKTFILSKSKWVNMICYLINGKKSVRNITIAILINLELDNKI